MKINKQTPKDQQWIDETGLQCPYTRTSASERLREKTAYALAQEAIKINERLTVFKDIIREACNEVANAVREENKVEKKQTKGNFTWFNFDRSIKVECSNNEQIDFDDTLIAMCQEKLNEFLNRSLEGTENAQLVRQLVNDAFNNTRGKLDTKKVMTLLKYRNKIESKLYEDAMDLLEQSIRRPGSKTYYRVWVKDSEGIYQVINLNFSSI